MKWQVLMEDDQAAHCPCIIWWIVAQSAVCQFTTLSVCLYMMTNDNKACKDCLCLACMTLHETQWIDIHDTCSALNKMNLCIYSSGDWF